MKVYCQDKKYPQSSLQRTESDSESINLTRFQIFIGVLISHSMAINEVSPPYSTFYTRN